MTYTGTVSCLASTETFTFTADRQTDMWAQDMQLHWLPPSLPSLVPASALLPLSSLWLQPLLLMVLALLLMLLLLLLLLLLCCCCCCPIAHACGVPSLDHEGRSRAVKVAAARPSSSRRLCSVSAMPAAAQQRSKPSPCWKHTQQGHLVGLVRLVDVEHWSRSGDLRMCVSAARQGTCACWRSPGAVRSRGERS